MYQIRKKCADFCRLKKKAQFSRPEIFDFRKKIAIEYWSRVTSMANTEGYKYLSRWCQIEDFERPTPDMLTQIFLARPRDPFVRSTSGDSDQVAL